MARPRLELQEILAGIEGVQEAYFQPKTGLQYPCIVYERSDSWIFGADNLKYLTKKRYSVTVIDRNPDSSIPDQVEDLPLSTFDRFFRLDGLNHFVFQLYF